MMGADAGAELGNGEHVATGGVFEGYGIEMKDESPSARPGLNAPLAQDLVRLVKERTGRDPLAKLGWTDVARFSQLGIPAVNLGAGDPLLAPAMAAPKRTKIIRGAINSITRPASCAAAAYPIVPQTRTVP